MNTSLLPALVLLTLSLTQAFPQARTPPPLISVSGSAEVKVPPDEVYLRVGVETRHATLADAKVENDQHVAMALGFLKRSDVESKDVQTDYRDGVLIWQRPKP